MNKFTYFITFDQADKVFNCLRHNLAKKAHNEIPHLLVTYLDVESCLHMIRRLLINKSSAHTSSTPPACRHTRYLTRG